MTPEKLLCSACDETWERPKARGRKPKVCPSCRANGNKPGPLTEPEQPAKMGPARKPEQTLATVYMSDNPDKLPFMDRPGGWCTDYDPAPKAQHDKCRYDLGSHRCPCHCHKDK